MQPWHLPREPDAYQPEVQLSLCMQREVFSSYKFITNVQLAAALDTLMATIGKTLAVLHDGGLIHGDLTTSNMIVRDSDKALVSCATLAGHWDTSPSVGNCCCNCIYLRAAPAVAVVAELSLCMRCKLLHVQHRHNEVQCTSHALLTKSKCHFQPDSAPWCGHRCSSISA